MIEIPVAIGTALGLSYTTYINKMTKGERFSLKKTIRTFGIGVALGVASYLSGAEITAENWAQYLAANAGIIAMVDQVIKYLGRLGIDTKDKPEPKRLIP